MQDGRWSVESLTVDGTTVPIQGGTLEISAPRGSRLGSWAVTVILDAPGSDIDIERGEYELVVATHGGSVFTGTANLRRLHMESTQPMPMEADVTFEGTGEIKRRP